LATIKDDRAFNTSLGSASFQILYLVLGCVVQIQPLPCSVSYMRHHNQIPASYLVPCLLNTNIVKFSHIPPTSQCPKLCVSHIYLHISVPSCVFPIFLPHHSASSCVFPIFPPHHSAPSCVFPTFPYTSVFQAVCFPYLTL
jgi:hypothetical protein